MRKINYQLVLGTALLLMFIFHPHGQTLRAQPQDISTQELQAMMDSGQEFALINVLPKIIYDNKHLPGSFNYPIGKLVELANLKFLQDTPLVFYCMGYF